MTHEPRCAGLIYGPELHHLDHLAPLCSFMKIPLVVTEENIAHLAQKFYPELNVVFVEYLTIAQHLIEHFEIIFYSIPRDLFDEVFFFVQKLSQKKLHTIWCPHGNSDKGQGISYMEALKKEEAALVYGKQMIDFLKRKHVFDQLKKFVVTGNYRYQFYLEHKDFYDAFAQNFILRRLPPAKRTLFYAPTWQDYEQSSSFFEAIDPLIEKLPDSHNLLIKLHPNLYLQEEQRIERIIEKYEPHPNVLFISEFPAIFPLLQLADVYIGDMSSIGYDFLCFNRPMFFLNQNSRDPQSDLGLYLFRCGMEIKPEQYAKTHEIIEHYFQFELRDFSEIRKEVNALAFAPLKPLDELRREIETLYTIFPHSDLNFF